MQQQTYLYPALRPKSATRLSLARRRQWFVDAPAADSDSETPTPPATGTPPVNNGGQDGGEETFTFTSKALAKRLDIEREKTLNAVFERLGVKNADEIQAILEADKKRKEADLSEGDKLKAELETLKAAKEAAESKALAAEAKQLETVRDTAIIGALTGADRPQSVLTLLKTEHAEQVTAVLKDDGSIDDKALKELDTLARKEYANNFKAQGHGSGSHAGGKVPTDEKQRERLWRRQTVTPSKRGFN